MLEFLGKKSYDKRLHSILEFLENKVAINSYIACHDFWTQNLDELFE